MTEKQPEFKLYPEYGNFEKYKSDHKKCEPYYELQRSFLSLARINWFIENNKS